LFNWMGSDVGAHPAQARRTGWKPDFCLQWSGLPHIALLIGEYKARVYAGNWTAAEKHDMYVEATDVAQLCASVVAVRAHVRLVVASGCVHVSGAK
jgi:hypothetical protein